MKKYKWVAFFKKDDDSYAEFISNLDSRFRVVEEGENINIYIEDRQGSTIEQLEKEFSNLLEGK